MIDSNTSGARQETYKNNQVKKIRLASFRGLETKQTIRDSGEAHS